jgi:hypothetical protein
MNRFEGLPYRAATTSGLYPMLGGDGLLRRT